MKIVRIVDVTPPRRAPIWAMIAAPVLTVLALAGAALTAVAFLTVFLLLAGVGLVAVLGWHVSGLLPQRRPAPLQTHTPGPDRATFEAYLNARDRTL